jgi:hypothetical protein
MTDPGPEPATPADPAGELVRRTRSAVLNVLVVVGGGIALSGLILRDRRRGATLWPPDPTRRAAYVALLGLVVASVVLRRVLGRRSGLRDQATRAGRFFRAHLAGALAGALAVPLGLAYAYAVRPDLEAVAPFWVAALALGFLSLPRPDALSDLDAPPPPTPPDPPTD